MKTSPNDGGCRDVPFGKVRDTENIANYSSIVSSSMEVKAKIEIIWFMSCIPS